MQPHPRPLPERKALVPSRSPEVLPPSRGGRKRVTAIVRRKSNTGHFHSRYSATQRQSKFRDNALCQKLKTPRRSPMKIGSMTRCSPNTISPLCWAACAPNRSTPSAAGRSHNALKEMLGTRRLELLTRIASKRRRTKPGVEVHSTFESLKTARDVIRERTLELAAKPANPLGSN